jgi:hypothetical protein
MIPQIMLATALPLVSAAAAEAGAGGGADPKEATGGGAVWACRTEFPQLAQKRLLSATVAPHFEQNTIGASRKPEIFNSAPADKLHETYSRIQPASIREAWNSKIVLIK